MTLLNTGLGAAAWSASVLTHPSWNEGYSVKLLQTCLLECPNAVYFVGCLWPFKIQCFDRPDVSIIAR
jgi:hypothetical protein